MYRLYPIFVLILFSCSNGNEEKQKKIQDSLIKKDEMVIEHLKKNADSIEKINKSGERKIP